MTRKLEWGMLLGFNELRLLAIDSRQQQTRVGDRRQQQTRVGDRVHTLLQNFIGQRLSHFHFDYNSMVNRAENEYSERLIVLKRLKDEHDSHHNF
jgi:hypothetical protein